ncbi:MAG: hypothetical protein HRU12_09880 [Phaeodactylibacter sp.]|nr:hypothetical protein [Phaeodactylibacter sp.]
MLNQHRPDYRYPPLRVKQYTLGKEISDDRLARQRLISEGYEHDPVLDIWSREGELDCCICRGCVLELTPASKRHMSIVSEGKPK